MSQDSEAHDRVADAPPSDPIVDEGPGCMPGILAATVLMGIIGFITCGVSTWVLYGKRSELAVRTLEGAFIPRVEQSRLEPAEKRAVLEQLEDVVLGIKQGKYEDWQAAGVLQRISRLPVLQWGELNAVEYFIRSAEEGSESPFADPADKKRALRHLSRLRRAVELGKATRVDVDDVLRPVLVADDSSLGRSLNEPLRARAVLEVVENAKRIADREEVPDRTFDEVQLETIVRRQVQAGINDGTM